MPTTIRTSILINTTPDAITKVILDPGKAVLWTSDLERFEVVSGSPGHVGSIARLHYRQGDRRYTMEDRAADSELGCAR